MYTIYLIQRNEYQVKIVLGHTIKGKFFVRFLRSKVTTYALLIPSNRQSFVVPES